MRAESPYTALLLMGVVLFGFQVWINNLQTLPSDFFPKSAVASVFGLGGTSAAIASVLYNWGTGRVVDVWATRRCSSSPASSARSGSWSRSGSRAGSRPCHGSN